jgi:hypothetical protein
VRAEARGERKEVGADKRGEHNESRARTKRRDNQRKIAGRTGR